MPYLYPPPAPPCSLKSTRCTDLHRPPPPYSARPPFDAPRPLHTTFIPCTHAAHALCTRPAHGHAHSIPSIPCIHTPVYPVLHTHSIPCILAHTVPWGCAVAQVARYASSQRYVEHYDGVDPHTDAGRSFCASGGQRVATVLMYLNHVRCPPPPRFDRPFPLPSTPGRYYVRPPRLLRAYSWSASSRPPALFPHPLPPFLPATLSRVRVTCHEHCDLRPRPPPPSASTRTPLRLHSPRTPLHSTPPTTHSHPTTLATHIPLTSHSPPTLPGARRRRNTLQATGR